MLTIGLICEGKIPADNRVALTPTQCRWLHKNVPGIKVIAQHAATRCFSDKEYAVAGVEIKDNLDECDILLGIKEVPIAQLIPGKTYFFFSHTKKEQEHNRNLFRAIIKNKITLIDYECLTHEDGQRILGFGFFAGIVGAHNGMMAYGQRTGQFHLDRVYKQKDYRNLIHTYFGLKLPPLKIAVTGSGRVAHGVLEIMNLMGIHEVEPFEYLHRSFDYPVYVDLKGRDLYARKDDGTYNRDDFHMNPELYKCNFGPYAKQTNILMNGIYWDKDIAPLFTIEEFQQDDFCIQTIADITNDVHGSIAINIGDSTIEEPVYGVDRKTLAKTAAYQTGSVDVMAVGNLPNELPRDASRYFGEQLIKFVLQDLLKGGSPVIERATMVKDGVLTPAYAYLADYAAE
ncbi:MAG: alanine dehydrogenase [Bacteroidetes bacterium]|nr:alanine dehydrogenase [Bacteroidota bacterium]